MMFECGDPALTGSLELFRALAQLGSELVALHLLASPTVHAFITRFEGQGDNSIPKKPTYKDGAVWINTSQRFEGVPEAVWNFHVGGYQAVSYTHLTLPPSDLV